MLFTSVRAMIPEFNGKPVWEHCQFVLHVLLYHQQSIPLEHLSVRTSFTQSWNLYFVKSTWQFSTSNSSPSVHQIRRSFQRRPLLYHSATMSHTFVYSENYCFCLSWMTLVRCMNWFDLSSKVGNVF
uniref:Uncharacterized protein n=1 Tax=Schistocephalus solidus TaxID=70667 RepID=A0A0X3P9F7_SCHSO